MYSRIVIVGLDIKRNDPKYSSFKKLSSDEKIQLLIKNLRKICNNLQAKEPKAMWIIAWREFGAVTESDSRFISNKVKNQFKKEILNLTKDYPQLIVVAGAVASKKHFPTLEYKQRLDTIQKSYEEHRWIQEKEEVAVREVSSITLELHKIDRAKRQSNMPGIDVIRNTCYVFSGDQVMRHDKNAVYFESLDDSEEADTRMDTKAEFNPKTEMVVQPGKGRNKSPVIELKKPEIRIGIEMCREHGVGVLQHSCPENKPFIHFILSDSTALNLNHLHGVYVVHLDSVRNTQFLVTKQQLKKSPQVLFYPVNYFDELQYDLKMPIDPEYPAVIKIYNLLNGAIDQFPENDKRRKALEEIRNILGSSNVANSNLFDCLKALFKLNDNILFAKDKDEGLLKNLKNSLFGKSLPDIQKLAGIVLGIAKQVQEQAQEKLSTKLVNENKAVK